MTDLNSMQKSLAESTKLAVLKGFANEKNLTDFVGNCDRSFDFGYIQESQSLNDLKHLLNTDTPPFHNSVNFSCLLALAAKTWSGYTMKLSSEDIKVEKNDIIKIGSDLGFTPDVVLRNICNNREMEKNLQEKFATCIEDLIKLGANPLFVPDSSVENGFSNSGAGKNSLQLLMENGRYDDCKNILDIKMNDIQISQEESKEYADYKSKYETSLDTHIKTSLNLQHVEASLSNILKILPNGEKSSSNNLGKFNEKLLSVFELVKEDFEYLSLRPNPVEDKHTVSLILKFITEKNPEALKDLLSKTDKLVLDWFDKYDCSSGKSEFKYNSLMKFAELSKPGNEEIKNTLSDFGVGSVKFYGDSDQAGYFSQSPEPTQPYDGSDKEVIVQGEVSDLPTDLMH